MKLAGCRGFFTPPLESSLGGSREGRRAWGRGGGGVLACLRARSSGRRGFLPRFFLTGSCLAARAGGLFWGEEGRSRRRGPGRAFFTWSSSSEEEEEAEEERPEDEEEEERLDLAAAGTGSWKLEKHVMSNSCYILLFIFSVFASGSNDFPIILSRYLCLGRQFTHLKRWLNRPCYCAVGKSKQY